MRIIFTVCDTNIISVKEPRAVFALTRLWILPDGGGRVLAGERGLAAGVCLTSKSTITHKNDKQEQQ